MHEGETIETRAFRTTALTQWSSREIAPRCMMDHIYYESLKKILKAQKSTCSSLFAHAKSPAPKKSYEHKNAWIHAE